MDQGRQSKGRQEIDMEKKIASLYKEASELSKLANVGIVAFSPTNEPISFFSPNQDSVVNRFLNKTRQPLDSTDQVIEAGARAEIDRLTKELEEIESKRKAEEERAKRLDAIGAPNNGDIIKNWLGKSLEELSPEELRHLQTWIPNLIDRLAAHSRELKRKAELEGENPDNGASAASSSSNVPSS